MVGTRGQHNESKAEVQKISHALVLQMQGAICNESRTQNPSAPAGPPYKILTKIEHVRWRREVQPAHQTDRGLYTNITWFSKYYSF